MLSSFVLWAGRSRGGTRNVCHGYFKYISPNSLAAPSTTADHSALPDSEWMLPVVDVVRHKETAMFGNDFSRWLDVNKITSVFSSF